MKKTQFKLEDVFGDTIGKDNTSQDQGFKPNISSAKMMLLKILV